MVNENGKVALSPYGVGIFDIGTATVPLNKWTLITAIYNATTGYTTAYIDGVYDGTRDMGANPIIGGVNNIGGHTNYYTDGLIDDVRVWNRILSPSEIKQLYAMGAGAVANAPAPTTKSYATGGLKTGLVGHWTFDGPDTTAATVSDKSVSGHNGTRNGSTSVIAGKLGQALKFVGNGYVSSGGSPASGSSSLFAWIKPSFLGACPGSSPNACEIAMIGGNFLFEVGSGLLTVYGYNFNSPTWVTVGDSGITTNKWMFVGFTYDQTTLRFYLNGVQIGLSNNPGTMGSGGGISIGGGSDFRMFKGVIDDVRNYNRALSIAEIKQLYQMGK
jgi:hypothetical protein